MKRLIALVLLGCALAGCSAPVKVSPPRIGIYEAKVPGRYAVMLQSGAWRKDVENEGFTCGAWSFPTDFDEAYSVAAREGFSAAFEEVDFTPTELKPDEVRAKNYDAQIIVYQGGLDASYLVIQEFWSNRMAVAVELDGIVAVTSEAGLVGQESPRGESRYEQKIGVCSQGDATVARAGNAAVRDFVLHAVDAARKQVRAWREREAVTPTS